MEELGERKGLRNSELVGNLQCNAMTVSAQVQSLAKEG